MHSWISKYLLKISLFVCTCSFFACSGGGGGNGESPGNNSPGVIVSGKVAANIVYPGTVRIYGVNADGTLKSPALAEGQTASDGSYVISIGGYQGAIIGKAFGRFTDEATKTVIDIPEDKCLFAALSASEEIGKSTVTLFISPLSDLVYRIARSAGDFPGNIAASSQAIAQLFGVDITRISPVSFDAATFSNSATTSDQVRLEMLLAVFSQFTANGSADPLTPTASDLQTALTALATGITVTGGIAQLSPELTTLLQQAVSMLATNANTQPVVAAGGSTAQAILSTLATLGSSSGTKTARFRLRSTGSYSGNLYGISVKVGIPPGFALRTDSSGLTQSGVVVTTGQAGVNSSAFGNVDGTGSVLTVGMGNPNGFGIGEFVTVYGEIPAASSAPLPGAFTPVTVIKISDKDGNSVPGIGVEVF